MKLPAARDARHWRRLAAFALATLGGCLNPLPDDLPSSQNVSPGAGSEDGASPVVATPPAAGNVTASGTPTTPATRTPPTDQAAPLMDAGPPSDAATRDLRDAGVDAGPAGTDLGVR